MLTLTVSMMLVAEPGVSGPGLVQVTACPAAEHAQPLPLAETKPRLAGRLSITVIVASVLADPALLTVSE